jgi:hypothetical protein
MAVGLKIRRSFQELVIEKLAIAKQRNYKLGWIYYDIRREIAEGHPLAGFYQSELEYLARRIGYRPQWAHYKWEQLPVELQLGESPSPGERYQSDRSCGQSSDDYRTYNPLLNALNFLGLSLPVAASELKTAYRMMSKRYHPDAGGTSEQFLELQRHYEFLRSFVK